MEAGRCLLWTGAECSGGAFRVPRQLNYGSFARPKQGLCKQWSAPARRASRSWTVRSEVKEGEAKSSESGSSEEGTRQTGSQKVETASSSSGPSNPFASGKISSRIAAKKQDGAQQSVSASGAQKGPPTKPTSAAVKPPPDGQLSDKVASQLKVTRPPSSFTPPRVAKSPVSPAARSAETPNPFRRAPMVPADWEKAGARAAGSGKRVLDAFKEAKGTTTKFGQPQVPKDIFDEVRRTPEEIAADAFRFEINPGQLFLLLSFVVVIGVMLGTALLVWKVGAIHYNEY